MAKINYVVQGEYEGRRIGMCSKWLEIAGVKPLTTKFVASYNVLSKTQQSKFDYNMGYIGRQKFGFNGWLLGTDGIQYDVYEIFIEWRVHEWNKFTKGGKSIIVLDDEHYARFLRGLMYKPEM